MQSIVDIFTLLFAGFAILVGIGSLVSLSVFFKHAEKKSVATEVALVYATLFLFIVVAAFSSISIF